MNHVTLYSNGTAVISREYRVEGDTPVKIQIPVSKVNLDDVISSLSVFGEVAIASPPTYAPTNAQATSLTLESKNILVDMVTKLAGAEVEVEAGQFYKGRLVGLQPSKKIVNQQLVSIPMLVVLTEKGLQQVELEAVVALRFIDAMVQGEINKALQTSLQKIKPDSSFVELSLRPLQGPTTAILQYATPVAAWKIRYHLRMTDGRLELDGQAIVDNDTDDDWVETMITTVTGEPITFSTDLAEIGRPNRSRVNLVRKETKGAVSAAQGRVRHLKTMSVNEIENNYDLRDMDSEPSIPTAYLKSGNRRKADQTQAEVRESGSLSIFHSPHPFSIQAHRSAIIPLFRTSFDSGKPYLFYNERHDTQNPFRAIRFVNQSSHSLGRGVCEVFIDGDFQGKSILESTKQGQDAYVIYARETGVVVSKKVDTLESRLVVVKLSGGKRFCRYMAKHTTRYTITNDQATEFQLELEHLRTDNSSVELEVDAAIGDVTRVEIPGGERIGVKLLPLKRQQIKVVEQIIHHEDVQLDSNWLVRVTQASDSSLLDHPVVAACLDIQQQIDETKDLIDEKEAESKARNEEQKRVIELIPHAHPEQAAQWRHELAELEKQQRDLVRTTLPQLKQNIKRLKEDLSQKLSGLFYEWNA
ncbi:MAG: hypothetical protein ACKO0V_13400 [bacterium]